PIPGLEEAGYLTNVEALQLDEAPARLVVIGGGPLGLEFAQIFSRFGSHVTVLEVQPHVVPRAEPEISAVLQAALEADGIAIRTGVRIQRVESGSTKTVVCGPAATDRLEADAILVATGIRANTEDLARIHQGCG
ncbi:MAG TPA: FAD-dependent oxidoreductase, partial [Candidatus Dormibacteraeota bacterium]|nr:FAD-dependent oxidoreductase [Candidatus Dormibacteraeota bacterium]